MSDTSREAELQAANERLERENALLRQKIDALVRRLFGHQSEQLDPAQLQLSCSRQLPKRPSRSQPQTPGRR